ncbi:MAG TPA: YqgE/AlgH family protein [Gammaproteobacteria bacterium]|nr:YqgE/AlgH family protein [Gammaproteobacteria bacterium]
MNGPDLTNHFLIAMPSLADPNFSRTVTYLCEHNAEGALGIIINRPTDIALGELLDHLEIPPAAENVATRPVFLGGPVQRERGFVLHRASGEWDSSLKISDELALTTSTDILAAIAAATGPQDYLVALGYAGWGPGQLEEELAENAWLSGPASTEVLFDLQVERRWHAAAALLGVNLSLLSSVAGRA